MTEQSAGNECVVIEDNDINDQPGPVRLKHNPSACEHEAGWFKQQFNRPSDQVVCSDIPEKYISAFKELIWNQPHDRMVPGYGMTPKELACVSSDGRKGWLVTSHFYWLSRCINQQQNHTCFFVLDPAVKSISLQKLLGGKSSQEVKRIIFVLSVGRQDDGVVFLGTDKTPGDHWSIAIVEICTGLISYCDTLGWPEPEKLFTHIIKYTHMFGLTHSQLKLRRAHQPNSEQHDCTPTCTNYPLQTCSDICGVIAMICISVAALDKDLFELMMKPIDKNFNLYLTDPTEFSTYLRHVLIYWIASNKIDITRISLKPNFDPFNSMGRQQANILKRKLEHSLNGDCEASPKRSTEQTGMIPETKDINEFINETLKNKETSTNILNEVIDTFGTYSKIKEANVKKIISWYTGFTPNTNIPRAKEDKSSTRLYLSEFIQLGKESPIILFKNKGTEMENLDKDDTVVAIQTQFQKEMMLRYGTKCICIELVKYKEFKFNIMTISVFFNGTIELPVAWLVSNKLNDFCINLFFSMLHSNVGNLQTSIFIGDINWNLHRLWIQHFPKPTTKMFNSWEIQHLFHNHLESDIPDGKIRSQFKNYMNALFYISDTQAFDGYVQALFVALKPYKKLSEYFMPKLFAEGKERLWASCHRYLPEYERVPFLEPFTHTMKVLDLFHKVGMKRMDTLVHTLLQLNRFLETKLYIMPSQGCLQIAVKEMNLKHLQPLDDIDIYQSASGDEWYIPASDKTDAISIVDSGITSCACQLKCSTCKICVHQYVCTCVDYLVKHGSCKHIHFIQKYKQLNNVLQNPGDSSSSSAILKSKVPPGTHKIKSMAHHELQLLARKINNIHDATKLQQIYSVLQDL